MVAYKKPLIKAIALIIMSLFGLVAVEQPLFAALGKDALTPVKESRAQIIERVRTLDAALTSIGGDVARAIADLSSKEEEIIDNAGKLNKAKIELQLLRATYNKRLVRIYQYGGIEPLRFFLNTSDFSDLITTTKLLIIIGENDARLVRRIARLESEIKVRQARLQVATVQQKKLVNNLEIAKQRLVSALTEVRDTLDKFPQVNVFAASLDATAGGFVFPVAPPYTYVDSWGAPRMTGTSYEHAHQGTDIMALSRTNALAVENGVIAKMGTNGLGGISLWLQGDSGAKYYYAHLYGYADGIKTGNRVKAGQVIGYVGDTGNARGTPHLHFETHPGGGDPVNPFQLLSSIDGMKRPAHTDAQSR